MRLLLFLTLIALAACSRPLTQEEKSFAKQIHGSTIDVTRIRVRDGALVGKTTIKRQKRPRLTCRERILPEPTAEIVTVSPAALVLYNDVFYAKDWYEPNFLPDYPSKMSLFHVMLFAHEITHVWQWQNREATNYTPLKSASEHTRSDDPYLFDINTSTRFLDYGFEQQASIVEEYVCCKALDPTAPRTERLANMLRGAFPLGDLRIADDVILPWDEAETKGICRI
ncbi:MAG: hypothetical protein AAGK79_08840 [Pseudomonadota bacterium]